MNLDEVRAMVVAQISADAALLALGVPFSFSLTDNEETVKSAVTARIQLSGVAIGVGLIAGGVRSTAPGRGLISNVNFPVMIGESPTVAHTPTEETLMNSVIRAICKPLPTDIAPTFESFEEATDEQGYVLRVLNFTVPVRIV